MAEYLDDIDFDTYMNITDAGHKVIPASAYADEVAARIHDYNGPRGDSMPWDKTHDKLRFRDGEVTIWAGYNGSGKSLVLNQFIIGLICQQKRVCIASMEMPVIDTLYRMAKQAAANQKPSREFVSAFFGPMTDGKLWMYDQQGTVNPERMLAVIRYFAEQKQGQHFVLDSFMKCGLPEDGPSAYSIQAKFIDKLTAIARDTGIHIHLVAHSRKGRSEAEAPTKMDVKGSGTITDLVHNLIIIWRNKPKEDDRDAGKPVDTHTPDTFLICEKQRNHSWEGRIGLWFDWQSGQFTQDPFNDTMDMLDIRNYARPN